MNSRCKQSQEKSYFCGSTTKDAYQYQLHSRWHGQIFYTHYVARQHSGCWQPALNINLNPSVICSTLTCLCQTRILTKNLQCDTNLLQNETNMTEAPEQLETNNLPSSEAFKDQHVYILCSEKGIGKTKEIVQEFERLSCRTTKTVTNSSLLCNKKGFIYKG